LTAAVKELVPKPSSAAFVRLLENKEAQDVVTDRAGGGSGFEEAKSHDDERGDPECVDAGAD